MSVVEAGIAAGARAASDCALCAHHAATHAAPRRTERHDELIPWGVALTAAVVIACVSAGFERWFGLGAMAGLAAGAICAFLSLRGIGRRGQLMHERAVARLSAEGDQRVEMVVRQFEWAVNDVVKLKSNLERAEAAADLLVSQARQRERYVRRLEQQLFEARERVVTLVGTAGAPDRIEIDPLVDAMSGIVPFRWSLHTDRVQMNLELECGVTAHRPSRVRLIDGEGNVVITSSTPMWSEDGRPCFTIAQPPVELVVALDAGRETVFHFEALADYEWRPVRLEDSGRRTKIVTDKQGRLYRVSDEADAAQLLIPPTTLN